MSGTMRLRCETKFLKIATKGGLGWSRPTPLCVSQWIAMSGYVNTNKGAMHCNTECEEATEGSEQKLGKVVLLLTSLPC